MGPQCHFHKLPNEILASVFDYLNCRQYWGCFRLLDHRCNEIALASKSFRQSLPRSITFQPEARSLEVFSAVLQSRLRGHCNKLRLRVDPPLKQPPSCPDIPLLQQCIEDVSSFDSLQSVRLEASVDHDGVWSILAERPCPEEWKAWPDILIPVSRVLIEAAARLSSNKTTATLCLTFNSRITPIVDSLVPIKRVVERITVLRIENNMDSYSPDITSLVSQWPVWRAKWRQVIL